MPKSPYTTKQMGDAAEMLVAAELTLFGVPALKAPDNWPDYDVIAQPKDRKPQRVSVKCRPIKGSDINFKPKAFDWLAIVLIGERPYRFFIVPQKIAVKHSVAAPWDDFRTIRTRKILEVFASYENNFRLKSAQ